MADINVRFMHPIDDRVVTVTLDSNMTAQEAINELHPDDGRGRLVDYTDIFGYGRARRKGIYLLFFLMITTAYRNLLLYVCNMNLKISVRYLAIKCRS